MTGPVSGSAPASSESLGGKPGEKKPLSDGTNVRTVKVDDVGTAAFGPLPLVAQAS